MSLRVRLLVYVGVPLAAVAVLTVAAALWWRWDSARQPKVDSDLPAMDQAIAATVTAAGPKVPLAISGVFQGAVCDLGPLRDGGRFTRSVDLYTDPGGETALIDRIAAGLPAGYQPRRGAANGSAPAPLTATPSSGVQLTVSRISPGWVVARARTGCISGTAPADPIIEGSTASDASTITALLATLGTRAAQTQRHAVGCPGGVTTVSVVTAAADASSLSQRLADQVPPDATRVTTSSNRVAYRTTTASVIVSASDDNTAITLQQTTPC